MPYMKADNYGSQYVDLEAFARDLAAQIGAELEVRESGRYGTAYVHCPEGVSLHFRHGYGARTSKVDISASLRDNPHKIRADWPSATVDESRDMAAIAKDIRRRVITPSIPILESVKAQAAELDRRAASMKALAAELQSTFAGLSINISSDGQSGDVYFNRDGAYLSGSIDYDGHVNVQRLSLYTPTRARALFALIATHSAEV